MEHVARVDRRTSGCRRRCPCAARCRCGRRSRRPTSAAPRRFDRSNTTGRSMKIAWSRVIMKSCIIVPAGHGDLRRVHERTGRVEHVIRQERRHRRVAEEVQLAGLRAQLRMGGERGGQLAAEVVAADRVELRAQLVRAGAPPRAPRCGRRGRARGCSRRSPSGRTSSRGRWPRGPCSSFVVCTQRLRYHSALPPSRRTPCTMPSPKNQWPARSRRRVRPVAQVAPRQRRRDGPRHLQVELR